MVNKEKQAAQPVETAAKPETTAKAAAPKQEKKPNKVLIAIAYAAVLLCAVMVCLENAVANGIIG